MNKEAAPSLRTAINVLKQLRKETPEVQFSRKPHALGLLGSQYHEEKINIPRANQGMNLKAPSDALPEILEKAKHARNGQVPKRIGRPDFFSPTMMALHEYGHAKDPVHLSAFFPSIHEVMKEEQRANQNVISTFKKVKAPLREQRDFKNYANTQIKHNYFNPSRRVNVDAVAKYLQEHEGPLSRFEALRLMSKTIKRRQAEVGISGDENILVRSKLKEYLLK